MKTAVMRSGSLAILAAIHLRRRHAVSARAYCRQGGFGCRPPQRYLRCVIGPHMSVEPLLSGQILCVLLERERVELRGYESRMTGGGPRHNTGEHHGHGNADQNDFAHLTVPLTNAAVSCLSRPSGDLA